jgi:hypothetical protein
LHGGEGADGVDGAWRMLILDETACKIDELRKKVEEKLNLAGRGLGLSGILSVVGKDHVALESDDDVASLVLLPRRTGNVHLIAETTPLKTKTM